MAKDFSWEEVLGTSTGIAGGPYTQQAQGLLSAILNDSPVRLTTSGTDALELAGILVDFGPGDTVMVPSFGFVTTALAFVRAGAQVRFVDIDRDTLGMDPRDIERKMDPSVKAIVPIHYAGYPCDIDGVTAVAKDSGALVVEDNAHGLFGSKNGRPLGTFGEMACLSFHGTKNVSSGEGGAIVLNRTDLVERAEVVLEKGTDRQRFLRGEIDKYTWQDMGSSFGMGDYLAAVLASQLVNFEEIQRRRREASALYTELLTPKAEHLGLTIPSVAPDTEPAYHLFYVLLHSAGIRDDVVASLQQEGIGASTHYPALHLTPGGQRWSDGSPFECPTSEIVADSIVRLPLSHRTSEADVERAVSQLAEAIGRLGGS